MKQAQEIKLKGVKQLASQVAQELRGGEIVALIGPLGAGKTTFAKALAKKLCVEGRTHPFL